MARNKKSGTADELIEALLEPRVIDAITGAIVSRVTAEVETRIMAAVEAKLLAAFESKISETNAKMAVIVDKLKKTECENVELSRRVESMERYQRQDNLMIHGIKETSYAERASSMQTRSSDSQDIQLSEPSKATEETVVNFCRDILNVTVTPSDISVAHRLGRRSGQQNNTPLPIIVKFTNRKVRQNILAARKSLRTSAPGVYVNENLTTTDSEIHKRARALAKTNKISKTWTHNGIVMIRKDNQPATRPEKILSIDQLNQYL